MRIGITAFATGGGIALALALAGNGSAQEITRMSVDSSGGQLTLGGYGGVISGDGQTVGFVSGDSTVWLPIMVHERASGLTETVTVDSAGIAANATSVGAPALSADGQIVAFASNADNLVAGDTNGVCDVFVRDRVNGTTERVSVDSAGAEADGMSFDAAISADGQVVAFFSLADNLVAGDTNGTWDVFVHDRTTGVTERMSVDSSGAQGNAWSMQPAISADGRIVTFVSDASNLVPGDADGIGDIFTHDRTTGVTQRVTVSVRFQVDGWSWNPTLSADGRLIAFDSTATTLVLYDFDRVSDVFVFDRTTGVTERVSVDPTGGKANGDSYGPSLSGDGRFVAFWSYADNLVPGDTNGNADAFLRDRLNGTTTMVSADCAGNPGDGSSAPGSISSDGTVVAFDSEATKLVAGDTNGQRDVFVNDLTVPPFDAFWTNYGVGYAGTLGVPTLTASADPVFGTSLSIDASNSSGAWSIVALIVGVQTASVPTSAGGTLLVDPLLFLFLGLPPTGASLPADVPRDPALCGFSVYLQALELDAGAPHGISFSPGLQLAFGH